MILYVVKTRVVYVREVIVEATSKHEARQKARAAEWVDTGDEEEHQISIVGKVAEEEQAK